MKKKKNVVCSYINEFRKKLYDEQKHNCHDFVYGFLERIGIRKEWLPEGPIMNFIDQNKRGMLKLDDFKLNFFGVTGHIQDHMSLKNYWELIKPHIKSQDPNNKQETPRDDEDSGKYKYKEDKTMTYHQLSERYEVVQIMKGLERGFILRKKFQDPKIDFMETMDTMRAKAEGLTAAIRDINLLIKEKIDQLDRDQKDDQIIPEDQVKKSDDSNNNNNSNINSDNNSNINSNNTSNSNTNTNITKSLLLPNNNNSSSNNM